MRRPKGETRKSEHKKRAEVTTLSKESLFYSSSISKISGGTFDFLTQNMGLTSLTKRQCLLSLEVSQDRSITWLLLYADCMKMWQFDQPTALCYRFRQGQRPPRAIRRKRPHRWASKRTVELI